MDYIPNTDNDKEIMLKEMGEPSVEKLLDDIPPALRQFDLKLNAGMTEPLVLKVLNSLSQKNVNTDQNLS
ncbi:MAG: glycine dehydrogenase, partial [Planctomycetota bacterium]